MKEVMFGHLDVHLERWDSSYCPVLDEGGTYQHIFKILFNAHPYHWVANDWRLGSAVTEGPPYVWPNPDSFVKCIAFCFEVDPKQRPTSSELLE